MEIPGLIVDPVAQLHERYQVRSAQVELLLWSAKIETTIFRQLAFGVLALVSKPGGIRLRPQDRDRLCAVAAKPDYSLGTVNRRFFRRGLADKLAKTSNHAGLSGYNNIHASEYFGIDIVGGRSYQN